MKISLDFLQKAPLASACLGLALACMSGTQAVAQTEFLTQPDYIESFSSQYSATNPPYAPDATIDGSGLGGISLTDGGSFDLTDQHVYSTSVVTTWFPNRNSLGSITYGFDDPATLKDFHIWNSNWDSGSIELTFFDASGTVLHTMPEFALAPELPWGSVLTPNPTSAQSFAINGPDALGAVANVKTVRVEVMSFGVNYPGQWAGIDEVAFTATNAIPEPATWAMMLAGFGLAGLRLKKRRKLTA